MRPATAMLLSLSLTLGSTAAQDHLLVAADVPVRATVAAALRAQLAVDALSKAPLAIRLANLRSGAATAGAPLPDGSRARRRLDHAVAEAAEVSHAAIDDLRAAIAELQDDLAFQPVRQADLPTGFPGFQAVDEIELRHYPAYRMARTPMRAAGSMGAFWPLFRHIESHGIAMTTPVQMDLSHDGERADRATTMAFLYGNADLGSAGHDGVVEVVDVPAATVLSIGARGYERTATVTSLREELQRWLAAHPEWVAAGSPRTFNYNSPMVAGDRRYWEVQLPVRRLRDSI